MARSFGLQWFIVFVISLVVSLVSITFLFVFGLILIEYLMIPVALGITGLLTALTAVYSSNRLVKDQLRAPYTEVVKQNEWIALVFALLLILLYRLDMMPGPPIVASSVSALVLAISAVIYASRIRISPGEVPNETRQVVIWLVIAVLAMPVVILIASLFGLAGA